MKEIVFIAPYKNMYNNAKKVIEKNNYENVDVVIGDLENGLEQSFIAVENGSNVVISRGGTYTLIKKELRVPVVELHISAYDVINSIKHIIGQDEAIAIIGYGNIIYGYDLLVDIQKINIRRIEINGGNSENIGVIIKEIKECAASGIFTFMGDAIVNTICQKLGYKCFMIESGEDSIRLAIEEAQSILTAYKNEVERNKRYVALIDCVHDAVVATDDNNRVLAFNSVAQEISGFSKNMVLGQNITNLPHIEDIAIEITQGKNVVDKIKNIQGIKVNFSNIPIIVNGENKGSVAIFQDVRRLQSLERKIRTTLMGKGFVAKYTFDSIIHESCEIKKCINIAKKFSQYDSSVLIEGGSGVGKELFAQSIHNGSRRKSEPFVAVNCAALPSSLIESELFGYAEGAFTGSKKGGKEGVFELSHKGTIFLDEISEIPLEIQGRLLRVIQEREVMRIGDSKVIPLDIRIICATNRNLRKMVGEGLFRQDLLYRINTLCFLIPELKNRKADIGALASHFLTKYCNKYAKNINGFSSEAMEYLEQCNFQGNVRELQGMIERAVIICESVLIKPSDFSIGTEIEEKNMKYERKIAEDFVGKLSGFPSLKEIENDYIHMIYEKENKSTSRTCEILKIDRSTLWRKIKSINDANKNMLKNET